MTSISIYADLETDSVREDCQIIQLSAIAVNDETDAEIGAFERKVRFDERKADPEALKLNHYDPEVWQREAIDPVRVAIDFSKWAKPFSTLEMISKNSARPYVVGRLVGHNITTFDLPRLKRLYGTNFFPFSYQARDTLQLAMWYFYLHPELPARPASLKLTVLAEYFGISTDGAHDALTDVRLSHAVAMAIRKAERNGK